MRRLSLYKQLIWIPVDSVEWKTAVYAILRASESMWGLCSAGSSAGVRLPRKKGTLFHVWSAGKGFFLPARGNVSPRTPTPSPCQAHRFLQNKARVDFSLVNSCRSIMYMGVDLFRWPWRNSFKMLLHGSDTQWRSEKRMRWNSILKDDILISFPASLLF